MRVAILYTGSLRTIEKTLKHFKRNVLLNNNVHVFACFENDTSLSNEEWDNRLFNELDGHMQSVVWKSNHNDPDWQIIKKINLENINTHIDWAKEYLKNSGSMFEHYQMQNAYRSMARKEYETGIKYDYIIRCRTDTIFCKPIDFRWLHFTDEELSKLIENVRPHVPVNRDIMPFIIYAMFHDDILENIINVNASIKTNGYYNEEEYKGDDYISKINDYIRNGKYLLGFRCNLLYICKRDYFHVIPLLGTSYGLLKRPDADQWWWNSESQFEAICYHAGLSTFNYITEYEEKTLYNFDRNRYFDENNEIRDKYQLFCLVRN